MEKEQLNEEKIDLNAPEKQEEQQLSSPPAAVGEACAASSAQKKKRNRRRNKNKRVNTLQSVPAVASATQDGAGVEAPVDAVEPIKNDMQMAQNDAVACVAQAQGADNAPEALDDEPVLQDEDAAKATQDTLPLAQDAQASSQENKAVTQPITEAASAKNADALDSTEVLAQEATDVQQKEREGEKNSDVQASITAPAVAAVMEAATPKKAKNRRRRKNKQAQNALLVSEKTLSSQASAPKNSGEKQCEEKQDAQEAVSQEEGIVAKVDSEEVQAKASSIEPFEIDAQEVEDIIVRSIEEADDDAIDLRGAFESETAQEEIRAELEQEGFDAQADEFVDLEDEIQEEIAKKPFNIYRFFVAATAIFAFMSALFVLMLFILSDSPLIRPKNDVDLPIFSGKNLEAIQNDAQYFKFSFEINEIYQKGVAAGIVVDQWPKPPKKVKENARIILRVSSGKNRISIPAVNGLSRLEAKDLFRSNDLSMMVMPEYSKSVVEDTVLRTEPAEGSVVDAGSTVTVYVSKGEEGENTTIVPGCVGLSLTQANQMLSERRLTAGGVSRVSSDSAAGTVIGQSPKAGTASTHGSAVNLTVSKGPEAPPPAPEAGDSAAAGGHKHRYVQTAQAAPGPDYIGFTTHTCTTCGDFYYDNVQQPTG